MPFVAVCIAVALLVSRSLLAIPAAQEDQSGIFKRKLREVRGNGLKDRSSPQCCECHSSKPVGHEEQVCGILDPEKPEYATDSKYRAICES